MNVLNNDLAYPTVGDKMLIAFANNFDPDQAQTTKVPADLDPNCLILWWYSFKKTPKKYSFYNLEKADTD